MMPAVLRRRNVVFRLSKSTWRVTSTSHAEYAEGTAIFRGPHSLLCDILLSLENQIFNWRRDLPLNHALNLTLFTTLAQFDKLNSHTVHK